MNAESTPQDRRFKLSTDELSYWNENGYLVRLNVFTPEENDAFRQVAEDIVDRKRPFPTVHIDQNALVRDGKVAQQGIYAMHKIHFPSCYAPEFLARVRDPRLTGSACRPAWSGYSRYQHTVHLESPQDRSRFPVASR